jgi:hypothetical protein
MHAHMEIIFSNEGSFDPLIILFFALNMNCLTVMSMFVVSMCEVGSKGWSRRGDSGIDYTSTFIYIW